MCGICGKLNYDRANQVAPGLVQRMMDVMIHRGPDGQGKYLAGPVGLGHLRLAIIDLNTGAQPMANEDQTVWIVFNGEIYNFPELRRELLAKGHVFSSATDTEVIIHLYEDYGVECLSRLQGMFAFAIWDEKQQLLFLARDRIGIKPLYYTNTGNAFLFGSEIKSLLVDPSVRRELDPQVVDKFLTYLYPPGRETLFKSIFKLEPGHYLCIRDGRITGAQYWDLSFEAACPCKNLEDAAEALRELLTQTVGRHMISDVPVGILLSGGVDSTAVLSCATQETAKQIKTFTVGFAGEDFADERPYARLAAQRFGTDHHEISISPEEFSSFLPRYVWHMEEPVCEPPAIALYYVSKLARKHVTVLLSGEGGDEAFGGYQTYRNLLLLEKAKSLAGPLKGLLSLGFHSAGRFHAGFLKYAPLCSQPLAEYYYSRAASPFSYFNQHKRQLYSSYFQAAVNQDASTAAIRRLFQKVSGRPLLDQMLYVDSKTWLPDDLLIKADKMTMANSLELRVPLLDHRVLEFAASLPPAFKVKGWATKRVFKRAFSREIPPPILTRRKTGFPVPLRRWLEKDLREFARETLLSERALARGYFQKAALESLLAPGNGKEPLAGEVFSLLVLEIWHQKFAEWKPSLQH